LIVNGHGGNEHLLPYFAQTQLDKPHDYVVYVLGLVTSPPGGPAPKSSAINWHAGEDETSKTMISHPDLVHLDRATNESGADQKRIELPDNVYTGIWWYGRFPYHYSGEGGVARKELGQYDMDAWVKGVVTAIKAVKADSESLKLQSEFYEKSKHPIDTEH
jgi:creatinine amidohydrolase